MQSTQYFMFGIYLGPLHKKLITQSALFSIFNDIADTFRRSKSFPNEKLQGIAIPRAQLEIRRNIRLDIEKLQNTTFQLATITAKIRCGLTGYSYRSQR